MKETFLSLSRVKEWDDDDRVGKIRRVEHEEGWKKMGYKRREDNFMGKKERMEEKNK